MRRFLLLTLVISACAAPPPPEPEAVPPAPEPAVIQPVKEKVIGNVRVTASALNVRREASTDAEVVVQVKKGDTLALLAGGDAWMKVRLASGEVGWVAARFVSRDGEKKVAKKKSKCPVDSDFAFVETPLMAFAEGGAHGMVVVEASVSTKGSVMATKVVSNSTGDGALAFLAEREIKAAKFSPPIRNCVPRAFIFTYRRTF